MRTYHLTFVSTWFPPFLPLVIGTIPIPVSRTVTLRVSFCNFHAFPGKNSRKTEYWSVRQRYEISGTFYCTVPHHSQTHTTATSSSPAQRWNGCTRVGDVCKRGMPRGFRMCSCLFWSFGRRRWEGLIAEGHVVSGTKGTPRSSETPGRFYASLSGSGFEKVPSRIVAG